MVNKVASTFNVELHLQCTNNCTVSPICDSYNYRPSDKTWQLNTHNTQHILDSCVHAGSGLVLRTRRASSTPTILHSLPTRPTWSLTSPGPGGVRSSAMSSKRHRMSASTSTTTTPHNCSMWSFLSQPRACIPDILHFCHFYIDTVYTL